MQYLVSSRQMKEFDRHTISDIGIPSLVLMERAAFATCEEIMKRFSRGKRVLIVAGTGNNGGDGLATGRILKEHGYKVSYMMVGNRDKVSPETLQQMLIVENQGDIIHNSIPDENFDIIVDAIFGIGLNRPVIGPSVDVIVAINAMNSYVVSADIPSGISADTGAVLGVAVKADLTVTYGFTKMGLILYPGTSFAGDIKVRKIGIALWEGMPRPEAFIYDKSDFSRLPSRTLDGHKGTFGKVLVIAGSQKFYGACQFTALGAYKIGCGLVRVITSMENKRQLMQTVPEAMVDVYNQDISETLLKEALSWASVVVIGPGIGTDKLAVKMMEYVWHNTKVPLVVDADGINILATKPGWLGAYRDSNVYITPHIAELSRLTNKSLQSCQEERFSLVRDFAVKYRTHLVSKDARTIIGAPDGRMYVNISGDNGMATGGSGDVLSGIMGGLIAQGLRGMEAAAMAVYIHGLAGNAASRRRTAYSAMASDIINEIPLILAENLSSI